MRDSHDFRVRVQAALSLGKSSEPRARHALEAALADTQLSVRVAAAVALRVLGDVRAIPALAQHQNDPAPPVRAAIKSTLNELERKSAAASTEAAAKTSATTRVLVQLGPMNTAANANANSLALEFETASRKELAALPGIRVLRAGEDSARASARDRAPVVLVHGRVRQLGSERVGNNLVYSATVEFVVLHMPERSIAATVSGNASTKTSSKDGRRVSRHVALQREVLDAAVASAVRRAPRALLAAARL